MGSITTPSSTLAHPPPPGPPLRRSRASRSWASGWPWTAARDSRAAAASKRPDASFSSFASFHSSARRLQPAAPPGAAVRFGLAREESVGSLSVGLCCGLPRAVERRAVGAGLTPPPPLPPSPPPFLAPQAPPPQEAARRGDPRSSAACLATTPSLPAAGPAEASLVGPCPLDPCPLGPCPAKASLVARARVRSPRANWAEASPCSAARAYLK